MPTPVLFLSAAIGTAGFCLILRVDKRHILPATAAGLFSYTIWYLVSLTTANLFLQNFLGALSGALLSQMLAILMHVPTTVFHTGAMIPLVPGGMLYSTMSALINGDMAAFTRHGGDALRIGLGIAAGIILGGTAMRLARIAVSRARHIRRACFSETRRD